jgi:hypothetical protein
MAKKRNKVVAKKKLPPTHIELIDNKTAKVREFTFAHATKILRLQHQSGLGTYTIYNVQLYKYDEGSNRIILIPQQSESSEGNSIIVDNK